MANSDVTNLLRDRIDTVEKSTNQTRDLLSSHVTDCAAIQKRVLILSACILAWMMAHSPEATKAVIGIADVVKSVLGFLTSLGLL